VIGIDPGEAIGLAVIADGKVIEEGNCFSTQEVINSIIKTIRNVNFSLTSVSVKIGNGVPVYKELLEALDDALPPEVALEVVGEAGTNRPLKENKRSRGIRHISSAIQIAGRTGYIIQRRKAIATNSRIQ
jgi:sugar-specific transcriptional regulator TrmB